MKIKTRFQLSFVLLVAVILFIFSAIIYVFYVSYRNHDFAIRLKNKAINSSTLLFTIHGIDDKLMKIIDDRTVTNMNDVSVIIMDVNKKVIYSNRDWGEIKKLLPDFLTLNLGGDDKRFEHHRLYLCFQRSYNNKSYIILASAVDVFGQMELQKLLIILISAYVIIVIVTMFAGYINAVQSLKPIRLLIGQIGKIKPDKLHARLVVNTKDEIQELAQSFNSMLEKLELAFENERSFVTHVSHELRTPITSVIGQLEVTLLRQRGEEEYRTLILSVLEDVKNMKTIINGFLDLADAKIKDENHLFTAIRADELLFAVKEEILKRKPQYSIIIEFESLPVDENDVIISGNEHLLKIMLTNIIDNSCKFSGQNRALVKIACDPSSVTLRFIDKGIGIPAEDVARIFEPLFRARNVAGNKGHGIGLSIVKHIVDLHKASINIDTELNVGTTVSVTFPKVPLFNSR